MLVREGRPGRAHRAPWHKAGHLYDLLGHSLGGAIVVEPYLITLKHDAVPYTEFRHAGIEFIYMLSGKVRYRHADRSYVMEPGDALFFDAAARHGPEELIKAPMTYLFDHYLSAPMTVRSAAEVTRRKVHSQDKYRHSCL